MGTAGVALRGADLGTPGVLGAPGSPGIGVSRIGSNPHYFAVQALRHFGIDSREVSFIQAGGAPETLAALVAQGIDAAVLTVPTDAQALKREVTERVGVEVEVGANIGRRTHDYDGYSVDLALYQATFVGEVEPKAVRVADCRWVTSGEFEKYRFPAADQATMDLLLGIKRG
jgi:8-oxo-dGTP pyrophosphatase MutT (NUDIX family)